MNYMRQVGKKKLLKWLEEHQKPYQEPGTVGIISHVVSVGELFHALDRGELDMVRDYRIHGEGKKNEKSMD